MTRQSIRGPQIKNLMNYKAPRGTHDIWGKQAEKLHRLEEISRQVFERYDCAEIRLPTFEDAGLFMRSIGDTTDIVEKEMYVFEDRKGRKLALRPEGTASVVRSYLENNLAQNLTMAKLFYMGSMFRYERPQAGRYREFFQIGAEYFSNPAPVADAEIIMLSRDILRQVGLKEINVRVHTLGCAQCRPAFRKALTEYLSSVQDLCADCQRRMEKNPLRVLDCKVDGHKLTNLPKMEDFLCGECLAHFCRVQELLSAGGCSFEVDYRLVRGLDYYTRTIFEIRSSCLGSQDALAAGGRYDNLVQELGGNPTPAVGFALGSERVVIAADNQHAFDGLVGAKAVFIAVTGQPFEKEAFALATKLRSLSSKNAVITGPVSIEGPFSDRSLKSQFRLADKLHAEKVIIFGEEEFKEGAVMIRDMKTQQQEKIKINIFDNY